MKLNFRRPDTSSSSSVVIPDYWLDLWKTVTGRNIRECLAVWSVEFFEDDLFASDPAKHAVTFTAFCQIRMCEDIANWFHLRGFPVWKTES